MVSPEKKDEHNSPNPPSLRRPRVNGIRPATRPSSWPCYHREAVRQGQHHAPGDEIPRARVRVVPTGSLGLDIALGSAGLPRGPGGRDLRSRVIRQDHAGAARVAQAQKLAASARSSTQNMAGRFLCAAAGRGTDDLAGVAAGLRRAGPRYYRDAGPLWAATWCGGSVAALTPRAELEGEMGDSHMGLQGAA